MRNLFRCLVFAFTAPPLVGLACLARWIPKRKDMGLGPEPLVNYLHFAKALQGQGYSTETFVIQTFHVTSEFDLRFDRGFGPFTRLVARSWLGRCLLAHLATVFRYRCVYQFFNGGALSLSGYYPDCFEVWLYKLTGLKVVAFPYGGDVQDLTRCPNLLYKHALSVDYPNHAVRREEISSRIDLWTRSVDAIVAGADCVDYLPRWDILLPNYLPVDEDEWSLSPKASVRNTSDPLRVLHAPNHRTIKGTSFFREAVKNLKAEGVPVELELLENKSNDEVRQAMERVDVVADQLVIGWYGMFAVEAMAMGKPVLCYLRQDLIELYEGSGAVEPGEIPIANCSWRNVTETLRDLCVDRELVRSLGERSRRYVERRHSVEAIGRIFAEVNRTIGLEPSEEEERTS